MLRQKPTQILPLKLLKEATIPFYCLFDESHFSEICTIMELKEINWLCKHMSDAANLAFQWIFVLNSVKHMWLSLKNFITATAKEKMWMESCLYMK